MRTMLFAGLLLTGVACVANTGTTPVALWSGAEFPKRQEMVQAKDARFSVIKAYEPENDGFKWLHGVALARHNGRLYASYGTNSGKENTAGEQCHVRYSVDDGRTWSPPQVIAKSQGDVHLAISHGVLLSKDGTLYSFMGAFTNHMEGVHTRLSVLDRGAKEWKDQGVVAGDGFWPMQAPVKMADGNWIMGGLRSAKKVSGARGDRPAVAISAGDDFASWRVIAVEEGAIDRCWGEATVDVDGPNVTLTSRPGWNKPFVAFIATSADYGKTWTPMRATNLPMASAKPYTGRLADGRRYAINSMTADGGPARNSMVLALSRPGEWTYSQICLIRSSEMADHSVDCGPKCRLCYPVAVEHEGRLYIAYSNSGGRGGNFNSAELAVVPIPPVPGEAAPALALEVGQGASWTNIQGTAWSRSGADAISCQKLEGARYAVTSTGAKDWSLNGMPVVAVEPGEEFIVSCATKPIAGAASAAPCQPCLVTRDRSNAVVDWYYLGENVKPGDTYTKRFVVPQDVFSIYARVAGAGPYAGELGPLVLTRTGRRPFAAKLDPVKLESEALEVTLSPSNGAFTVTDRRTGRTWTTDMAAKGAGLPRTFRCVSAYRKSVGEAVLLFGESDLSAELRRVRFELVGDTLTVTLNFPRDIPLPNVLRYPAPFATKKGDRLIIPRNEGMGYPVDEEHLALRSMTYACGYVLSMPFFGVVEDATGAGYIAISETHEDGMLEAYRLGTDQLWAAGTGWMSEFGRFGYARRVRYEFSPKGGVVALAKDFRAWAKRMGWVKTFAEKALTRPHVERLHGAPNMWPFMSDGDKLVHAKELQSLGIDRFLWSAGGNEEVVRYLAGQKNVLVGRYDNAQDVFHPRLMARMGRPGEKGKWHESFPQDCMWTGPTSNTWRHAWGIEIKEGTNVVMEHCATLCDARAAFYERDYAAEELKTKPYNARFMDTTFSEPWKECRAPAHPMNRRESRLWRLQMLRTLQDEFGLVTGSERGSASTVPVCDYYEGMMSISGSGVPRAGRDMAITWTNELPEACAKYAVNPVYRLPLWELVFHDCSTAYWYWGDGNLKVPGQWAGRDLFNVLYGTPPLFLYTKDQWPKFRDGVVRSYKRVCPVVRACGGSEMVDHRILAPDRRVQRTVFANGVVVTVNFSEAPWTDERGQVIGPGDFNWHR